jgi:hypothetical protein
MKNFNYLLLLFFFYLVSCGSLKEATKVLRNEKIKTTDEFLVEKRDPLVFPPDHEKMPVPGTKNTKKITEKERIKKILNAPEREQTSEKNLSSIEESLLESIRK